MCDIHCQSRVLWPCIKCREVLQHQNSFGRRFQSRASVFARSVDFSRHHSTTSVPYAAAWPESSSEPHWILSRTYRHIIVLVTGAPTPTLHSGIHSCRSPSSPFRRAIGHACADDWHRSSYLIVLIRRDRHSSAGLHLMIKVLQQDRSQVPKMSQTQPRPKRVCIVGIS